MATICVYDAAAGSNNGTNWANAYTSIASALPASANDTVLIDSRHNETLTSTTTLTPAAGVTIYSVTQSGAAGGTYNAGATINFVTASAGNLNLNGGSWKGVNFIAGNGGIVQDSINLCSVNMTAIDLEECTQFLNNSSSASIFTAGVASATAARNEVRTTNCTFKFGATGQGFATGTQMNCRWTDVGSNFDGGSVHPTLLFRGGGPGFHFESTGGDFSANANTLFPNGAGSYVVRLSNCKLNASATIQTTCTYDGSGDVYLYDCASGDTHYNFAHYNYRGSTVATNAKYVTADGATYDGTNRHSLTVTGVNATFAMPYYSPWIDAYTAGGSAVTPYFETAREGSATKFNNNEVWAQFAAKTTASSTRSTLYSDRVALLGTPAAQATGAGTGAWTGLSGTAASQKLDSGAALTPAVIGYVRGRIAVAGALTVQLDPQIRGL